MSSQEAPIYDMVLNQDPEMAIAKPEEAFYVLIIAQCVSNLPTLKQEGD